MDGLFYMNLTVLSNDSFCPVRMIYEREKAIIENVKSSVIECIFIQTFHS